MVQICCINSIENYLECCRKNLSKPLFIGTFSILIYDILIYLDVEVAGPVLQLLCQSICRGVLEPGRESVLCELSRQFVREVVLVGNVPTKVCQVMLSELFLLASLLNLDGKSGYNNAVDN